MFAVYTGAIGETFTAGGDLYAGGLNEQEEPWRVGIRHPVNKKAFLETVEISNQSLCTSGGNAPQSRRSPNELISTSIIAPYVMMAYAFTTECFLMNADDGKRLLEQTGLAGIMMTPDMRIVKVGGIQMKTGQWLKSPKGYFLIADIGNQDSKGILMGCVAMAVAAATDIVCSLIEKRKRMMLEGRL